jgi:hypothetical protein
MLSQLLTILELNGMVAEMTIWEEYIKDRGVACLKALF